MAHSLSAKKRVRQNTKRRLHRKSQKNALKALVKRLTVADAKPEAGKAAAAPAAAAPAAGKPGAKALTPLVAVQQKLDRMAAKGVIHANTAARRKSRLARKAAAAKSAPAAAAS